MPGRSLHPASLGLWAETPGTATPGEKGWVSSSAQLLPHSGTLVGRVTRGGSAGQERPSCSLTKWAKADEAPRLETEPPPRCPPRWTPCTSR